MPAINLLSAKLLAPVALIFIWQLASTLLASEILPSPIAVITSLYDHLFNGELLYHLGMTLYRVFLSFTLALLIGTWIGIVMGHNIHWNNWLDVVLILGLNIPALVTIILCYIWFGLTEIAAIMAVAINKIPTVVVMLREGARAIDHQLLEVAKLYRLSRTTTLLTFYLPQLYPYLFAAARNGLALIWKIVLVVELLGRSNGIGFQLGNFFQFFDIQSILAYTLAFVVVILIIEAVLLQPLEKRLNQWRS